MARALLALLLLSRAAAAGPAALTPAAYRAELDRLLAVVEDVPGHRADVAPLLHQIPPIWRVEAGSQSFDIPTSAIRRDLESLQRNPTPEATSRLRSRLDELRRQLDAYEAAPRDLSGERRRAAAILARPEFSAVHGPTWFDRLKQRALTLLIDLLGRIVGSSNLPTIGRVAVFTVVGLSLIVAAAWIYRGLRRTARHERLVPEALPVSAKPWRAWLAEARSAAQEGDWRDGVRLAYWAAISFLEEQGVWPADRARTPREYLRLLPPGYQHREALTLLTRSFERVWYGGQGAGAGTFAEVVAELERLGCRPS